jgi:hypothetical protein
MIRAVRAGYARLTMGTLPDVIPADAKPRKFSSLSQPPEKDARDKTIETLTALLVSKLSPAERKELAGVLGK